MKSVKHMKTASTDYYVKSASKPASRVQRIPRAIPLHGMAVALVSCTGAAATLLLTFWASQQGSPELLASVVGPSGIVFLAMAIDSKGKKAFLQLITGLALMTLGWAIFTVATSFVIVAGALATAWLVVGIVKMLSYSGAQA